MVPVLTVHGGSDSSDGGELCDHHFIPTAFSFQMKQNLFLRESTHVDSPMTLKFWVAGSGISTVGGSQTSLLLAFKPFVLFTCVCQCYTETPSILGRHNQRIEIGLEYENASPKLELIINFPQFLTSPYWGCENPKMLGSEYVWACAATWVKFEINLTWNVLYHKLYLFTGAPKLFLPGILFDSSLRVRTPSFLLLYQGCPGPHNYYLGLIIISLHLWCLLDLLFSPSPLWIQNTFFSNSCWGSMLYPHLSFPDSLLT